MADRENAPWVATYGLVAPYGKCQCGCGNDAPLADRERPEFGWEKGKAIRFYGRHQPKRGTIKGRFWALVNRDGPLHPGLGSPCWFWTGARSPDGYGAFNAGGKSARSHRYAWELLRGPIPAGMVLCHKCHNPACVNPEHLYPGTQADNVNDMMEAGRHNPAQGERGGWAKLTEEQVAEARRLRAGGARVCDLAEMFGLHESQMSRILSGREWKHSYTGPEIPQTRFPKPRADSRKKGQPNPMILCACGCGKELEKYDKYNRPRKIISGHNRSLRHKTTGD